MAVTPVRTRSPSTTVVCPTCTPSTSVMALRAPGEYTPGAIPRSRALGLVWAPATAMTAETAEIAERHFQNDAPLVRRRFGMTVLRSSQPVCWCLFIIEATPLALTADRYARGVPGGASLPSSAF